MSLVHCEDQEEFLAQLAAEIHRRIAGEPAHQLTEFARIFFSTVSLEELAGRSLRDVFASMILIFQELKHIDATIPRIRIFNPTIEEHGWTSNDTVVAVFTRDMPFVVDSLRLAFDRHSIQVHTLNSSVLDVDRLESGELRHCGPARVDSRSRHPGESNTEAIIYFEVSRLSEAEFAEVASELDDVLADVALAVSDFDPMRSNVKRILEELEKTPPDCIPEKEVEETCLFLKWMLNDHFTFLGVTEVVADQANGAHGIREIGERRLGLLRKRERNKPFELLHEMNPRAASLWLEPRLLGFSKSSVRSSVHRNVYADYVTIKTLGDDGDVLQETRFLGLFTSSAYTQSPFRIPVIREKLAAVMNEGGIQPSTHHGRYLQHVLESYPRDELFQINIPTLLKIASGITHLQERKQVRLFARRDDYGRFYSCLVYVPRDLYHTELRCKISDILCEAFETDQVEFTTYISDSVLARTHFILRTDPKSEAIVNIGEIESRIIEATKTWEQHFEAALVQALGTEKGAQLAREFSNGFPSSYIEHFDARVAVRDVQTMVALEQGSAIGMSFSREIEAPENHLRFKLFQLDNMITLSDVIPVLENLGVRVIGEYPYPIARRDGRKIWIHDFELEYKFSEHVDLRQVTDSFTEAFRNVWLGRADSDGFNRLILGTQLSWREAMILRAYARYMKQTGFPFSLDYIADTLSQNLEVAQELVTLFHQHFDPRAASRQSETGAIEASESKLQDALESVASLDQDRIIRRYVTLIKNTLRTNFYQRDVAGNPKAYLAIKLAPRSIPNLPKPLPRFEIFVHSARTEGVHLRWGRVSRGGVRFSDRQEDFRTEILGLAKAQQVKNAVIVPVGAKGGFVARRAVAAGDRDAMQKEGIACYRQFINGLLDLTDNYVDGKIESPADLFPRDQPDPYLVVAADKGTATFSDIANEISEQGDFWLRDAFASGGSIGYDHKKMGITARGAWVSVQRHFRELDIDVQSEPITVVGIGDMSGDVFGNGMLLSETLKLVAAFNHAHIFLDPAPDPASSFAERKRMFALEQSSWSDYDKTALSKGGGVFERSAKSIPLSPEVRQRFGIEATALDPNTLIATLLKAQVDLVFNGGIGTYYKAVSEIDANVGDKANDALRVDAEQMRCRVLGEGGNLGITQLGRIEYCLAGGRANTDFIDNAAGVNCSDHEVNVKILLGEVLSRGDLTETQRRKLLEETTPSVAQLVLDDSFRQVEAISLAEAQATRRMGEYRRYISALEAAGQLDRKIEFIPDDETLVERKANGKSLTRPEISLLLSYTKAILKEEFCCDAIATDPVLVTSVESAFPAELREIFSDEIYAHRLKREIIATQVSNEIVNRMGFTFVYRMQESTGASPADIAKAYVATREVFDLEARFRAIDELGATVKTEMQNWLNFELMGLVRRCCRWLLRNRRGILDPKTDIAYFAEGIARITQALPHQLKGQPLRDWAQRREEMIDADVPHDLASFVGHAPNLHACFGMIEAADTTNTEPEQAAGIYFALGECLDLQWLRDQITELRVENHWHALTRENALDDLIWQERSLTVSILNSASAGESPSKALDRWIEQYPAPYERWTTMQNDLRSSEVLDLPMCSVALRELLDWAQTASH
jgi:glutamate dehydrogenase